MYIKESAIAAVALVAVIPLVGFAVNYVVTGILQTLFSLISRSGGLYLFFANRLTFAGVIWHELSHALFAFLTGAKVEEISLYHKEGNHLGYVKFRPRGIWPAQCVQLSLSACAPVIMGILALFGIHAALRSLSLPVWGVVIAVYLFVSILVHMDMSPEDLKSYIKGVPFFLIVFFVLALVYISGHPEALTTVKGWFMRS
ncbi:MAG: M50 family metallopeptidase [Lachnospiraceae bacterium]|nr:M50 family metallopeptidase [Lachnospiraceae bacterium]